MTSPIRPGETSTTGGKVDRVDFFFIPDGCRSLLAHAIIAACSVLAGCGSDSAALRSVAERQSPIVADSRKALIPPDAANTPTPAALEEPSGTASDAQSIGADVLLLVPAGIAELPKIQSPSIAFKNPTEPSTQPLRAILRASSRSPATTDGGRSGSVLRPPPAPQTGNATISWDPPLQNADGSTIRDLAGYRVYQGDSQRLTIVQELNETGAGERRLTRISNVASNNACFSVTAFDSSLNESALSEVVCKNVVVTTAPTNDRTPDITSVTQLSSQNGVANVQLIWIPPSSSFASAGAEVVLYSIYHGTQSRLFKIKEVEDEPTRIGAARKYAIGDIGGEQACFALTARYNDGLETALGEIVCIALVHNAAPPPGEQLRPYNINIDMVGPNTARLGWDKPTMVVSSADATAIKHYDIYQGSRSQVYKLNEIDETGAAGNRRTSTIANVFIGSNCFALTATDISRRQSALSSIVCADMTAVSAPPQPSPSRTLGVTNITLQKTSPTSVTIAWDAPELIATGQPIANLSGYNLYQGSNTQLFKVAEQNNVDGTAQQQIRRSEVDSNNSCFAVTAFDKNGYETPLSKVVCADISDTAIAPRLGIVPPTELATKALGGSMTVTLSWLASGAATTGIPDPDVKFYNVYQGNHDRLYKVRQVNEDQGADPRTSTTFTGVTHDSACFAITAEYRDLRESRLSEIVCRDD